MEKSSDTTYFVLFSFNSKLGGVFGLREVKIEFFVVSDKCECQLSDALYQTKRYCSSQSYHIFKSWNIGNYSIRTNFNRDFPKLDIFGISKSHTVLSHSFWWLIHFFPGLIRKFCPVQNLELGQIFFDLQKSIFITFIKTL